MKTTKTNKFEARCPTCGTLGTFETREKAEDVRHEHVRRFNHYGGSIFVGPDGHVDPRHTDERALAARL